MDFGEPIFEGKIQKFLFVLMKVESGDVYNCKKSAKMSHSYSSPFIPIQNILLILLLFDGFIRVITILLLFIIGIYFYKIVQPVQTPTIRTTMVRLSVDRGQQR